MTETDFGFGRLMAFAVLIPAILFSWAPAAATEAPKTAAVFEFELEDTSLEGQMRGVNPAETERIRLISDLLRRLMAESGRYEVVDLAPAGGDIADAGSFAGCNGCAAKIARKLGATLAVTGVVQKVSNLILNINIYVQDAESEKMLAGMSADIRGNTDRSWTRGLRWLVKNRLLKAE